MTKALLASNKYPWKTLRVEMFAHVQGRKDESREWGEHIGDKVVCGELGLVKNRADQCIYQGIINTHHVIVARATDDILIGTHSVAHYVQAHCCHLRISLEGS